MIYFLIIIIHFVIKVIILNHDQKIKIILIFLFISNLLICLILLKVLNLLEYYQKVIS